MKKIICKVDLLGWKAGEEIPESEFHDNWLPFVDIIDSEVPKEMDLNNDGKIDAKDAKIASKVLNETKKKSFFGKKKSGR